MVLDHGELGEAVILAAERQTNKAPVPMEPGVMLGLAMVADVPLLVPDWSIAASPEAVEAPVQATAKSVAGTE